MNFGEQENIASQTFADYGAVRFRMLCQGAGFGAETEEFISTFRRLLTPWGNVPIGNQPHWMSNIGDDHSPIEFSVTIIDQQPEVRVLMEVQGHSPTVQSQRVAGIAFNEMVEREFGASLDRLRLIQDLFLPENMQGNFAIWNAVVFSQRREPSFKIYLNPQAQGSEHAQALVQEALIRLGFPRVWPALEQTVIRRGPQLDEIKYFSLDLTDSQRARVKIYVHHHQATPEDLDIACSIADNYVPGEASEFTLAMSGSNQPLSLRSPFTCPSLVEGNDVRPAQTTLYIPVCAYAHDDGVVRDRVRNYLISHDINPSLYDRILKSYANRSLESGVGMQSWVAYRRQLGSPRLTVYLSTESYRVYPPGSVPASENSNLVLGSFKMKEVLDFIQNKKQDYAQLPLFGFMKDQTIDPRQRLSFAPCGAHFIMSFADLNKYVFREEKPCNQLQELINEHTYEDDHHLGWFLEDLETLGFDRSLSFPNALRFVWSEQTKHIRKLSYRLAGYTLQADPIQKLVVIETIEALGNVFFSCTTQVAQELQELTQKEYRYFGSVHLNVEKGHTTGKSEVDKLLEDIQLTEESRKEAFELVEKVFQAFAEVSNELLEYALTNKTSQLVKVG